MFLVKQLPALIPRKKTLDPNSPRFYYNLIRGQCQNSLWVHTQKGMGYTFIDPCMKDLCDWVQSKWNPRKPKRVNMMLYLARDTFKSTSITQSLPSWALSQNPNLAILTASKTDTNATNFIRVQKNRYEDKEFINIFGKWENRKAWGESSITIKQRKNWRKEASEQGAGIGTELTSTHWDIIIADDITTKKDMYSKAEREASKKFLQSLYDLADKKKCLIIVIGTCWHADDALENIKKQNPIKIKQGLMPFEIYERAAEIWKNGRWEIQFPFFTRQILDQIRADKADIRDYAANYRLKPRADESQVFAKFHYFDCDMDILKLTLEYIIIFIDPSLKDTAKNDFSAIVAVGKQKVDKNIQYSGRMLCLEADLKRRKPTQTIADMAAFYLKLRALGVPIDMYMETNFFQEYMKDEAINQSIQEGVYLPLAGVDQKINKIMRITGMEKYSTSGQLLFRRESQQHEGYREMMDQFRNFPLKDYHDDGPDACQGAVEIITMGSNMSIDIIEI